MCYNDTGLQLEEGIIVHKRKERAISLILAAALFLAGMYLNAAAQRQFFLHSGMGDLAICSEQFRTQINQTAGCVTETIGACGKEVQQSGKLDTLLGLLCPNHITLFTGNAFGCPEAVRALAGALDRPVVDYMHRADGKKRN